MGAQANHRTKMSNLFTKTTGANLKNSDFNEERVLIETPLGVNLKNKMKISLSLDFIEWFRGFTDAEGCFQITAQASGQRKYFEFRYSIGLHLDDKLALNYIQENLQIGKVKLNANKNIATYNIIAKQEVAIIIQLFSIFNLNSNKHLNFLAFKEAFLLYNSSNHDHPDRTELVVQIEKIKVGMNSKRREFLMPEEHKVEISPNWFLYRRGRVFQFKKIK